MRGLLAILLAALFLTIAPIAGNSQQMKCDKRAKIVAMLEVYKETSAGIGLAATGEVVELFVSEAGSFTILISTPQGMSCVASIGTDWNRKPAGKPI